MPVEIGVGEEERELLALYPQPRGREASVEYVPGAPEGPTPRRQPERPQPVPRRRTAGL